ncbi:MAG TPA: hypothetical protein VFQ59_03415 [Candidatus Paceibacterota bacterium]|nr:hypothetical protein [Candidatus Paceibacterota bacterium]
MQSINYQKIAIIVAIILLIPLFGNFFLEGFDWGVMDFAIMGILLFITGIAIDYAMKKFQNPIYRVLTATIIIFIFLAIWAELSVDAVSKMFNFIF